MKRPASFIPRKRTVSRRHRSAGIALVIVGAFIAIVAACSNQGEGERCEVFNGNDDCKTGEDLVCTPFAQLRNTDSDRCCPVDRNKATHPICKAAQEEIDTDSATPPDTGPPPTPEASTPDAAPDASDDADAASDAGDAGDAGDADADQ